MIFSKYKGVDEQSVAVDELNCANFRDEICWLYFHVCSNFKATKIFTLSFNCTRTYKLSSIKVFLQRFPANNKYNLVTLGILLYVE